jgi:hypothetical protein
MHSSGNIVGQLLNMNHVVHQESFGRIRENQSLTIKLNKSCESMMTPQRKLSSVRIPS